VFLRGTGVHDLCVGWGWGGCVGRRLITRSRALLHVDFLCHALLIFLVIVHVLPSPSRGLLLAVGGILVHQVIRCVYVYSGARGTERVLVRLIVARLCSSHLSILSFAEHWLFVFISVQPVI
jgi:hypothetical protein